MPRPVKRDQELLKKLGLKDYSSRVISPNDQVEVTCSCGTEGAVTLASLITTFKKTRRGWICRACQGRMSSAAQKGKRTGANNHFYGKKHTNESKARIGAQNKESWANKTTETKKEVGDRLKKGRVEKFGTDISMNVPEIKQNAKKAMKEAWDANHDERIDKVKETNLTRYGHEWATQSPEILAKTIETNLNRYGVEHPAQSSEIKDRMSVIFAERYGGNPMFNDDIKEKHIKSLLSRDNVSAAEKEISDFVKSFGYEVVKTYIGGKEPKEIDIHAVGTKFFLEFNGAFYHSDYFPKMTPSYHLRKTQQCSNQYGAHLIQIFDHEWENKRKQVEAFLSSKLAKPIEKIRASVCEVREINKDMANEFLDRIHLQGGTHRSFLNLGLFSGGRLISVASFSKPHRSNMDSRPHLSRYAIEPGVKVYGGLSKLSQSAFRLIGEFITFVHFRLSNGSAYKKSGYVYEKFIRPDYFYFSTRAGRVVSKQSRKKSSVKTPEGVTEAEFARSEGLYKVYDCGKIKFAFKG